MRTHERYELGKGSLVVFTCTNPAVGFIKRMAKDGKWADVEWISDQDRRYTTRVLVENLRPLNGVLNYWMSESKLTHINIKYANGNYYLPPGC